MIRGIERRILFVDDDDRCDLEARLSRILPESGMACFAWAFMPNHIHLVVRSGQAPLSRVLARIGTGFARHFNGRHGRVGHLFQNRFRSRVVADDADLVGVIRYVHRNPLAGGVVATLDALGDYRWSGHAALVGRREPARFHSGAAALALFGATPIEARERLRAWMEADSDGSAGADPLEPEGEVAPGVATAQQTARCAAPLPRDVDVCVAHVARAFGLDSSALNGAGHSPLVSDARAVVAHLCVHRLGLAGARIAARLAMSRSGVSRAVVRGVEIARERGIDWPGPSVADRDATNVPGATGATNVPG
jgi:REP element-mobilizing transposase RayT